MGVQEEGMLHFCVHRNHLWFRSLIPKLLKAGGSIIYHILILYSSVAVSFLQRQDAGWGGTWIQLQRVCFYCMGSCLLAASRKRGLKRGSLHIRNVDALGLSVILFSSFLTTLRCPTHQNIMLCQHNAVNFIIWNWGDLLNDFQPYSSVMELN